MTSIDWDEIKETKFVEGASPSDWPTSVNPISLNGVCLFGINKSDGRLFWDGKEVVVHSRLLKLRSFELSLLAIAAVGTLMQGIATFVPWLKTVTNWW